jgi:hypothetical protein
MGIALLAFADLWMPLQSLADRWLPVRRQRHGDASAGLRYVAVRPARSLRGAGTAAASATTAATPVSASSSLRPLRVVRLVDKQQQGLQRSSNRVVISGRMADVCAELERLAALEAAENAAARPRRCLH